MNLVKIQFRIPIFELWLFISGVVIASNFARGHS